MWTERLEIRIDPHEARWLGTEACRRGVSVGAFVREAIRRFREATEVEWYREPFMTYVHARLREGKP